MRDNKKNGPDGGSVYCKYLFHNHPIASFLVVAGCGRRDRGWQYDGGVGASIGVGRVDDGVNGTGAWM